MQKFRVWIADEGKDEKGQMFELPFSDGEHIEGLNENGAIEVCRFNDYIVKESGGNTIETDGYEPCEAIVMQYIDLKDMNKKQLCESDILHDGFGRVLLIESTKCGFRFKALTETNFLYADIMQWFISSDLLPEIIGNKYETPELLQKDAPNPFKTVAVAPRSHTTPG